MVSSQLVKRYRDAYRVFGFFELLAKAVKVGGLVIGAFVVLVGISAGKADFAVGGIFLGALIAGVAYVWGMLLALAPELGKAVLDTAVHTSPFLNEEQKLEAMGVKR